ncbi:MAG: hypothetical protein WBE26_07760, partial [Phycisphaerae bacterium]
MRNPVRPIACGALTCNACNHCLQRSTGFSPRGDTDSDRSTDFSPRGCQTVVSATLVSKHPRDGVAWASGAAKCGSVC